MSSEKVAFIDINTAFGVQVTMSNSPSDPIRVQVGPANYFSHPGALDRLAEFFTADQLAQALWIGGPRASAALEPFLPAFRSAGDRRVIFAGHCTETVVARLALQVSEGPVIGLGGGSALDTAKAVAVRTGRPFVALPTIAATCAAWTPLSVWYDDQGRALQFQVFPQAAFLVLVEPRILAAAPVEYLQAGIGDTLVKWYEAKILAGAVPRLPLPAKLGLDLALTIKNLLLAQGAHAVEANRQGLVTTDLVDVIDAIVAGGGSVGGFGERFTRVAAAHAVHNGLTVVPETANLLHGAKVAFGLLVQLSLEGDVQERQRLLAAYGQLGLPATLSDLGLDRDDPRLDEVIAKTLLPHESIHALPFTVTRAALREALRA
jgi:uncharacterized oxidoreductase